VIWTHGHLVLLLWAAAALVGLLWFLDGRGRARLAAFVSAALHGALVETPSALRRAVRLGLFAAALACGVLALMRPQGRHPNMTKVAGTLSADVIVVLDVSRSMLAEDAAPSRLERAKAEVRDLAAQLADDRLGLVAFAGRAVVLCPLTTDHAYFRLILDSVDASSARRGGTRIGEAIRAAVDAFPDGPGAKLIVLMTDGEDHDSYPVDAAKIANRDGVHIITVGFGDEKGSPLSAPNAQGAREPILDNGQQVISRLDGKTLRDVALATEGVYVPAGVGVLDLPGIVRTHVQPLIREVGAESERPELPEYYPWFVLGALACLLGAAAAGAPARRVQP
jgi:Ca-activated chloride channel homolog